MKQPCNCFIQNLYISPDEGLGMRDSGFCALDLPVTDLVIYPVPRDDALLFK